MKARFPSRETSFRVIYKGLGVTKLLIIVKKTRCFLCGICLQIVCQSM